MTELELAGQVDAVTAALLKMLSRSGPTSATPTALYALDRGELGWSWPADPAELARLVRSEAVREWLWQDGWRVRWSRTTGTFTFESLV